MDPTCQGPRRLLLPQAKFTPVTEPTAQSPPSIPLQCLPDPTPPHAYKKPSPSSPFPLFLQYPRRRQAKEFHRRTPQVLTTNIVKSDEVKRTRNTSSGLSFFLCSGAPLDDLRSSYIAGNRRRISPPEAPAACSTSSRGSPLSQEEINAIDHAPELAVIFRAPSITLSSPGTTRTTPPSTPGPLHHRGLPEP
jgi:hypothetical protein